MVLFFSSLECSFLYLWNGKFLKCRKMIQKVLSSPAAAAKLLQSCPTLCDPIDGSPPGSAVPGILQAITLEWVAISFSNAWRVKMSEEWKWKVKLKSLSRVQPSATPWTAAFQAPPSMGSSRQEYWSGVPLPSPRGNPRYLEISPGPDSKLTSAGNVLIALSPWIFTTALWVKFITVPHGEEIKVLWRKETWSAI